jgi:hypothetical protein
MTNGDTLKQLLARSRYFLYKTNQMVQNQTERRSIIWIVSWYSKSLWFSGFEKHEKQPIKL